MMKSEAIQHRSSMTISSISIAVWLLLLVSCNSGQAEGSSSSRCAILCQVHRLRDDCERCKLRVPMRFGKRSSPPQYMLEMTEVGDEDQQQEQQRDIMEASEGEGIGKQLIDDELAEQIFNYLTRAQSQLRSKRTIEKSDQSLRNILLKNYVTSYKNNPASTTNIRLKKHSEEIS